MGKIFKKLTFRTIGSNFRQFLSVILIVFLASMLMSGFLTNYSTLNNCINTYFSKTKLADCWLDVSAFSEQDNDFFKSIDGISYSKRLYFESSLKIVDSRASNNGKVYVYDGRISTPYIETGAWGCVIDKTVAENNDINVGYDEVEVVYNLFYNGEFIEIPMKFLITGTMCLDECADFESSWPLFITEEAFVLTINSVINKLNGNNSNQPSGDNAEFIEPLTVVPYNQVLILIKNLTKNNSENYKKQKLNNVIESAKKYYEEESSNELLYCLTRDSVESVVKLNSEIEQSRKMIYVFPVIFLIISTLIILTTIDQLVLQEKQKIGTLKSIGVPDRLIFNHYSRFGAILCAIGSSLGLIFGASVIPSIMFIKYQMVYSIPNDYIITKVPFWWLILVVVGITLLGYIVSMVSCHKVLHKKAIECLKFQVNNSKAFKNDSGSWLNKLPFSLKMAIRNIRLKPLRTFMATIGIAGCVAMLLCGYGIKDTLNHSMYYDFNETFFYDAATTYTKNDFEDNLKNLEGLSSYEKYEKLYLRATSDTVEKNTNVYHISQNSFILKIKMNSGECVVSESVAKDFNLSVGDSVKFTLGNVNKKLVVAKIIKTSSYNAFFICDDLGFDEFYKVKGVFIDCENINDEKINYINSINGTNTAKTKQESIESIKERISTTTVMTEAIKFYAISLAIVVLLNLIFLIVKERVREIATLKVLGRQLISIVLSLFFEFIFMGLIGGFVGMIFGYPMLSLVLSINKVNALNFMLYINFSSFVSSLWIVILTISIMMGLCYYKVKSISMIESLKSSE